MFRICLLLFLLVVSVRADAEISPEVMNNTDVSGAYVLRAPSGSPKLYLRDVPTTAISITANPYGANASAADNTAAIQSAINAAIAAGVPLRIPAAASCFNYTAPLTINGNLTIVGDAVEGNWGSSSASINVPTGTPQLVGSVLCPTSNGSDAIDITGTSTTVNISNLGILFQTPFSGTGDGINYVPGSVQGLSGSTWSNVIVYGHDGNHYGYNLSNFIYDHFTNVFAFGGGGFALFGTGTGHYGNSVFDHAYSQTVVGGTSNGFNVTASAASNINLVTFIRPQSIINNQSGVTPGGNPPTSAQYIFLEDTNLKWVKLVNPDFETNVSSKVQMGNSVNGNDWDWNSMFTTAAAIEASSWTSNGLLLAPQTHTVTDTTSSGTVTNETLAAIPGYTQKASNATTYTHLSTLYLGNPSCSTNCTATRSESLYTQGNIYVNLTVTTNGLFDTGTTQINANASTATTDIGDGTTSGTVTIGGNSNTLNLNAATLQSRGTAAVSCGAGTVNLTTFVVTNGIVTHC